MNTITIKKFAAKAHKNFSEAVTSRLAVLGIRADEKGHLEITNFVEADGLEACREGLIQFAETRDYKQLVEFATYTWFNRLCAIRYMEMHDYLEHGLRLLSHPASATGFEILDHAQDVAGDFELDQDRIVELKLAGDKDDLLYRELILGQCYKLHESMPFLFAAEGDMLDLLLPDNLTRTDSPIGLLVSELPDAYWQSLDLFALVFDAFYSDYKKTLPKKVGVAELPIATQVCEPKWVSQFMVENTLALRWKEINPGSKIDEGLSYYLPPVEQSATVASQLDKIPEFTSKSPEDLRVLDPACGSGSNLLQAYELLYRIYQEEGYRSRDIPQTILMNNLVGLDIDDRACQVSSLVLMLRAQEDDKRFCSRGITPAVFNLSSVPLSTSGGGYALNARELGFMLSLPASKAVNDEGADIETASIINAEAALKAQYDVIVCYPPNLGILRTDESLAPLKNIANAVYASTKSNLATMFAERAVKALKPNGFAVFLLKDSWLFLSRYEKMRATLLESNSIACMAHLDRGIIPDQHRMNAVVLRNASLPDYEARYCLTEQSDITAMRSGGGRQLPAPKSFPADNDRLTTNTLSRMGIVPGKPVSYWVPSAMQSAFLLGTRFSKAVNTEKGRGNISRDDFVRQWYEVDISHCALTPGEVNPGLWRPLVTGGSLRRWYGNQDSFVNTDKVECDRLSGEANTWTALSSVFNTRLVPANSYYDASGPCFSLGGEKERRLFLLGLTNSTVFDALVKVVYPENALGSIRPKDLANIPIVDTRQAEIAVMVEQLVSLAKQDWHSVETSWGFEYTRWLDSNLTGASKELEAQYKAMESNARDFIEQVSDLETGVNRHVIESYQLENEFSLDVSNADLSYYNNPYYQKTLEDGQSNEVYQQDIWASYRADAAQALISYGMGCILGRYRVENNGVTYAGSAGQNFSEIYDPDSAPYQPDADGIVPLTDIAWFKDDAAECFREWLKITFGADALDKNMQFLSESLLIGLPGSLTGASSFEVLRYYLSVKFYKHHVDIYQRKPVYWLFSSGKHKAFECLVYLHRYNEGTLSRMRTEYVTPLLGKYEAYVEQLQKQVDNAASTIESNRLKKELATLEKKQVELGQFDDKLKHYADMQISLDLDDGVKINYGKFGDLLADVKTIHGKLPT
jgi:SAM-dependent methyltransferase